MVASRRDAPPILCLPQSRCSRDKVGREGEKKGPIPACGLRHLHPMFGLIRMQPCAAARCVDVRRRDHEPPPLADKVAFQIMRIPDALGFPLREVLMAMFRSERILDSQVQLVWICCLSSTYLPQV